jgi:hypothetical protein
MKRERSICWCKWVRGKDIKIYQFGGSGHCVEVRDIETGRLDDRRRFQGIDARGRAIAYCEATEKTLEEMARENTTCHDCGIELEPWESERCVKCKTVAEEGTNDCPRCCADLEQYGIGEPGSQECTNCGWKEVARVS